MSNLSFIKISQLYSFDQNSDLLNKSMQTACLKMTKSCCNFICYKLTKQGLFFQNGHICTSQILKVIQFRVEELTLTAVQVGYKRLSLPPRDHNGVRMQQQIRVGNENWLAARHNNRSSKMEAQLCINCDRLCPGNQCVSLNSYSIKHLQTFLPLNLLQPPCQIF